MPCLGQDAILTPNVRIRVKPLVPPAERITGSFVAVADDSLSFERRGTTQRLALSDIESLQVSTGEKSHTAGTLIGGVTGALAGAWIGAAIENAVTDRCTEFCGATGGLIGFLVGGIGGAVAGYSWLANEKWANVPIDSLRVSLAPGVIQLQIEL